MYYYKARMYSPTLGRFMQTDPIGYKDQVNLYAYVGNDPIDRADPTGLKCMVETSGTCDQENQSTSRKSSSAVSDGILVAGAAGSAAEKTPKRITVGSDGKLRFGGPKGQPFFGNQSVGSTRSVSSLAKTAGPAITALGVAVDTKDQIDTGKPADEALVNAGSRGAFDTTVGAIAVANTPDTLGGSLGAGAIIIILDKATGGAVGSAAEFLYKLDKQAAEAAARSPDRPAAP